MNLFELLKRSSGLFIISLLISVSVFMFGSRLGFLQNFISVTAPVMAVVSAVYGGVKNKTMEKNNKEAISGAEKSDKLSEEVLNYETITELLQSRGIEFSEMLDKYADSSEILLVSVTDQTGPEDPELGDKEEDTQFVRWVLKDELNAVALTSKTWAVPPDMVPESLRGGVRDDIESWLEEEVYGKYGRRYSALLPMVAIVDLKRVYSKQDDESERHFGETLILEMFSQSETLTVKDYAEALADNKIDILDMVKEGNLRFYLPQSLSEKQIDLIRENQSTVLSELESVSMESLANPQNINKIKSGLSDIGVGSSSEIATEIQNIAQTWKNVLR